MVAPEAWLSTWSGLSSRAEIAHSGRRMTLPALVIGYSGDNCIFPSDTAEIASALGSKDVTRLDFAADHYGFPSERGRVPAATAIADWLGR